MYINITGSANNKDVYIYQSYRKDNGKTSSRIYKKRKRCTTPRSDTFSTFCYTLPRGFEAPKYRNAQ